VAGRDLGRDLGRAALGAGALGRLLLVGLAELLAGLLAENERELEKLGWIKISHYLAAPVAVPPRECVLRPPDGCHPTEAQIHAIREWCAKHGEKPPVWLDLEETGRADG
jgi:hypothetical protein